MATMAGTGPLKNSYMASGSFYKPEVVLDNVARSQPTDDGVIEIKARDVTGRLGISKNSVIIGAVVDGTGETGITAVCKLLLLPYADYIFRRAVPIDQHHLTQDLNLKFDEAKTFLQGSSSIGLSSPSQHVLTNMRALQNTSEFGWESTNFRTTYVSEAVHQHALEAYGEAPEGVTESYLHECNQLLDALDRKRQDEIHVLNEPRKTFTDIETLKKPGPLPSRKEKGPKINVAWAFMGILIFFGLAGFSMISKPVQLQTYEDSSTSAPPPPVVAQTPDNNKPPQPAATGTAPFSLPSEAAPVNPPPNPTPAATEEAEEPIVAPAPPQPDAAAIGVAPAPAASTLGNSEVNRCMDAVRRNPGDADARRKLAYAYLTVGDSASSIEQFYAVMKVQKVETTDIIQYADNMMVFCGRQAAKQFLSDMLRTDPQSTTIRQKLATL